MPEWTYALTRHHGDGTESVLEWNAPLHDVTITTALSSVPVLTATVPIGELAVADDGMALYLPWSTVIYACRGEEVVCGAIITDMDATSGIAAITAFGFAGYPNGLPHTGSYSVIERDALSIYRDMWAHVQGQAGGNLGLSITGLTKCGVLLGEPEVKAYKQAKIDGKWQDMRKPAVAKQVLPEVSGQLAADMTASSTSLRIKDVSKGNWTKRPTPFTVRIGSERVTLSSRSGSTFAISQRGVGSTKPVRHYKGTTVQGAGTETKTIPKVDAKPWKATWHSTPDISRELARLVETAGVEYVERHRLGPDGTRPFLHELYVARRIGVRRNELRFVVGENVAENPDLEWEGEDYANEVIVLGAGEGTKTLRATSATRPSRLRRAVTIIDKSLLRRADAERASRAELSWRSGSPNITELLVADHPNAPAAAYDVGDEIYVATNNETSRIGMWVRILSIQIEPGLPRQTLTVRRA
jgi:hypothetical protein